MAFTSALGSGDSVLGFSQELGGADTSTATVSYPPLVRINGEIHELPEGASLSLPEQLESRLLTEDLEIYVDVAGDDDEGDGTVTNPYLTIFRAAEDFIDVIPGEFDIIINIGEGVHTVDRKYDVAYNFGNKLNWVGQAESIANPTISNIDAAASTDGDFPELEYIDFDLDLTGSGAAVGHFVRVWACTGGTNPDGLNGIHEIVAFAAGIATCRVWRRLNTTEIPSGAITVDPVYLIKSVLNFTADDHGIDIRGPFDVGNWDKIVLKGNPDAYASAKRAVRLFNGAGIRMDGNIDFGSFFAGLSMSEWGAGIEIVGGATFYSLRTSLAKINDNAVTIATGSRGLLAGGIPSTINGVDLRALWALDNSGITANTIKIHSVGAPVRSDMGAFINVALSRIHYDQGAGTAIIADDMGRVVETGSTIVGFATDYSPAADTFGNNGSYIGTA